MYLFLLTRFISLLDKKNKTISELRFAKIAININIQILNSKVPRLIIDDIINKISSPLNKIEK